MGTIQRVLERFGFVRLRDYGLLLTPDRRVLSTRSDVRDDGFGQRVVGWADDDLVTMELPAWSTAPEQQAAQPPPPRPRRAKTTAPPPIPSTAPPKPIAAAPEPVTMPVPI